MEPPPSVCLALVVMELEKWYSIGILINGDMECDTIESPALAKFGIGGEVEPPSFSLSGMIAINRDHCIEAMLNIYL